MKTRNKMKPMRRAARRGSRWGGLALVGLFAAAGCDSFLDVENPNELVQEDLERPASARALVNGALATVKQAHSRMMMLHDASTDQLTFVGSRDPWLVLQRGTFLDPNNDFTDQEFPFVSEGRWMADEAIRLLNRFDEEGLLGDRALLARAKLYSAVIYTQIADLWEEFVISDRMQEGPPIRGEGMRGLYDTAIENLDRALPLAEEFGDRDLQTRILAQRARTKHARAIWDRLNPPGSTPADPLVADAGAVADAEAALERAPAPNWRFAFNYGANTVENTWGGWVTERLEHRISTRYAEPTADDKQVERITFRDPIDDVVDPALSARLDEILTNRQFGPVTVTSAQEMRLILAEAALATGDDAGFTEHMNELRGLDDLSPYAGQVDPLDLLKHSREVHLFNMGRRLNDHYRFGEPSFQWRTSSEAYTRPGTGYPIAAQEQRSNCFILGTC